MEKKRFSIGKRQPLPSEWLSLCFPTSLCKTMLYVFKIAKLRTLPPPQKHTRPHNLWDSIPSFSRSRLASLQTLQNAKYIFDCTHKVTEYCFVFLRHSNCYMFIYVIFIVLSVITFSGCKKRCKKL
jgi:hypothetical protein